MAVQRTLGLRSRRFRRSQRHGKDRVGTESRFVTAAVEFDHHAINEPLIERVAADERTSQCTIDMFDSLGHSFATVACGVPIAKLHSLA